MCRPERVGTVRVMTAWAQRVRSWLRDREGAADTLLAAGLFGVVLLGGFTNRFEPTQPADGWFVLLATVTVFPVAVRRRWPVPAFWVSATGTMVLLAINQFGTGAEIATLVCAYSVAAHARPVAARWTYLTFVPVITTFYLVGWATDEEGANPANLLSTLLFVGATWVLGDVVRRRRHREHELEERAARAERERQLLAQQAVAKERAAIARELHDSVAHAVSVIVIQAGAARRLCDSDHNRASEAIATVERTGREALAELRRVVGVLRDDGDPSLRPPPTLAALGELVAADPTLAVDLRVEGQPGPLPPSVELSAYRIVQEALTNVRKHAGPARADVVVRYCPDAVEVVVRDDGRGASAAPNEEGHGLVGMRERASLCGGTVHAGPRPGGGWQVTAHLPVGTA